MSGAPNLQILWEQRKAERAAAERLAEMRGKPVYRQQPMQAALRRALAPLLKEAGPSTNSLTARWSEIVGERLAKVTEPLRVQPGKSGATLHIRAPSAAAPMIQHAAEHIKEKVGLATGAKITRLVITQTAAPPPVRKPMARSLTSEERSSLNTRLDNVQTPAVKAALERLGEAVLTWGPTPKR